jgi:hypothetical protein
MTDTNHITEPSRASRDCDVVIGDADVCVHLSEVPDIAAISGRLLGPKRAKARREPVRIGDGRAPLEALPLFAPDNLLGAALLGRDRVQEWQQLAPLLEARGLPRVDQTMGGRFVPAVRAFFMQQYGLGASTALAPDGVEDFETWKQKPKRPD